MTEIFEGTVSRVFFRGTVSDVDAEIQWMILAVGARTIKGEFPTCVDRGAEIRCLATKQADGRRGEEWKVEGVGEITDLVELNGDRRLLMHKGMSAAQCDKIFAAHGETAALDVLRADRAKCAIPGFKSATVEKLREIIEELPPRDMYRPLLKAGLRADLAFKLARRVKVDTADPERVLTPLDAPYAFAGECGLSLTAADVLAKLRGLIDPLDRAEGALLEGLRRTAEAAGSHGWPLPDAAAWALREYRVSAAMVDAVASRQRWTVVKAGAVGEDITPDVLYTQEAFLLYHSLAKAVGGRAAAAPLRRLGALETAGVRRLSAEQCRGVRAVLAAGVSCIVGPPGVGKTACIRALTDAGYRVTGCALSARAALVLGETTKCTSGTIHSMLGIGPNGARLPTGRKLPPETQILVIDEASMVEPGLMLRLFRDAPPRCHIVLVGDTDQLAPVGAGRPFLDIVNSGSVSVTRLTRNYRVASEGAEIVAALRSINNGVVPQRGDERATAGFAMVTPGADEVAERALAHYFVDPGNSVIVTPNKKAGVSCSTVELNGRIRSTLYRAADGRAPDTREGDIVIGTKNDGKGRYRNGERGVVLSVTATTISVHFDGGRVASFEPLSSDKPGFAVGPALGLTWGYALTGHKVQGSEFSRVIVVLPYSYNMNTRRWLYTAVSRAKARCVLVADSVRVVSDALARLDNEVFSPLPDMLAEGA